MKNPDYERVDWLHRFISYMWPYLDKVVCEIIRSSAQPIFADYIGTFCIKFYETNEKELLFEPSIKWAGNSYIVLVSET
uniref:SMP-LTD domain-containing protein n=1 Tax=Brassica campestris TaxID=3711 RepID=M4CRU4_BRACM